MVHFSPNQSISMDYWMDCTEIHGPWRMILILLLILVILDFTLRMSNQGFHVMWCNIQVLFWITITW